MSPRPTSATKVIRQLVDAMRRSDPDYAKSHGLQPCYAEDWDAALEAGEDWLEESAA